jgi:hypothetical protein
MQFKTFYILLIVTDTNMYDDIDRFLYNQGVLYLL